MPNSKLEKESFLWRPSNLAWKPLFKKHEDTRRPINQILNDIVTDYFTPKLFDNVSAIRPVPEVRTPVAKRSKAIKKAKTKIPTKN